MKKYVTLIFILGGFIAGVLLSKPKQVITEGLKKDCLYGSELAREGFKGTEFEDYNFYKMCVENVVCSSPTKECPVKLIHEETKDWVQKGGSQ